MRVPWALVVPVWVLGLPITPAGAGELPESAGGPIAAPDSANPAPAIERTIARLQSENQSLEQRVAELERTLATLPTDEGGLAELMEVVRQDDEATKSRIDLMPDIAGYFDFEYFNDDLPGSPGGFRQHRFAIIPSKEHEDFRVFGELEFEYGTHFDGGGGSEVETARGEIVLEQGWVEYTHSEPLNARGGLILVPGFWNVNHYGNVVLSTRQPLMVATVFPPNFTGLMLYGSAYRTAFGCSYEGYVGNGSSADHARHDDNENKATGGRIVLHLPLGGFETIDVASHALSDHPRDRDASLTWGFETQMARGRLELLSEYARCTGSDPRRGLYAQPSLRFNEQLALFYRYDLLESTRVDRVEENTIGVNFRPIPKVALKLETHRSNPSTARQFNGVAVSVAIAI
jgi:hypothetical protein